MEQSTIRRAGMAGVALALLALCQRSTAVDGVGIEVGDIAGAGWSARGVSIRVQLTASGIALARVTARQVVLTPELGVLEGVSVVCRKPQLPDKTGRGEFGCQNAQVSGRLGRLGPQTFTADVRYRSATGLLAFMVRGLKVGSGAVTAGGEWLPSGWRLTLDTTPLPIGDVVTLVKPWMALPAGFAIDGRCRARIAAWGKVHGAVASLSNAEAQLHVEGLTANNAAGTVATDKLSFDLQARVDARAQGWEIAANVRAAAGQAYGDPIFIDFAQHALQADFRGRWSMGERTLTIEQARLQQTGLIKGTAIGKVRFGEALTVEALNVALDSLEFPGAYKALLQPFLLDTALKELETSGQISGTATIVNNAPASVDLQLNTIAARDTGGKLGVGGLRGHVSWTSSTEATRDSQVEWDTANAYGLSGGAARIEFAAAGKDFRLLKPTVLPILDGGIAIDTLSVREAGAENMSLRFNGTLRPISMRLLSAAFGWPEFAGTIEGRIPQVSYDNQVLSVGGDLGARVFGGSVAVNGLKLREPLGRYPRLNANVTLRDLDLQAITGTFSFGEITGRLDGDVSGLELFRWAPVKMDMRLYTPATDRSKHRISQRAVNNLSNIGGGGGGVAAALQSGLLRFFKNFRYKKLGLSCVLENEVCRMDGVEPAAGDAYYIVKGGGVPRIDIIGNSRRVDWPRLVGQLQAIAESEGPVVQ